MNDMLSMFYETIFGILALYILTRVLAKTQISQLTPFDFIAAVILGELVGNALYDKEVGVLHIGFIILLWGVILYTIEMTTQKFKGSRFVLEGKPSIIIYEGNIIYEEMRKNKLDIDELHHLLRIKDVFSIQSVEYAILETNGELSVLQKAQYQLPTKQDLSVSLSKPEIPFYVINDGELIKDNLREANMTEEWLYEELKRQNFNDIREVFYAEWLPSTGLYVQPYNKIKHKDYERKFK